MIKAVSYQMGTEYFLFPESGGSQAGTANNNNNRTNNRQTGRTQNANSNYGKVSLKLTAITFDDFLVKALQGTPLTYKKEKDLYLIGNRTAEGFRVTKVVQLEFRSVEEFESLIPEDLREDLQITPFEELNSLVLSGSEPAVQGILDYLDQVDRKVPVVQIEVIILDVQKGRLTDIGMQAGIGNKPPNAGLVYPNFDFTFNANSINSLLNAISGSSNLNLGQVGPDFYLSLRAVETDNLVKIRSKPKLSTLNSHEASFTIGETNYFLNTQQNISQGVNPIVTTAQQAQSADANFTINIKPYISGMEEVTLDIDV
ncbi:MAG: type II secretory pathway, component PulD, partial [Bacteroidota bacterium]